MSTITPAAPNPTPIPPSKSVLKFPQDHYLHPGAPTEWWWHTGTLQAGDRVFGFEINAAGFLEAGKCFTQVMLSDISANVHYKQTTDYTYAPDWAESDPSKPWYARLGEVGGASYVIMQAPQADPAQNRVVSASLYDADLGKQVKFELTFSQQGPPFIVWGTGVTPPLPPTLQNNNFYYSLTRLQTTGTITIGDDAPLEVTGLTWMDHEYGNFGGSTGVQWFLQDMQLDNGMHISHFAIFTSPPQAGHTVASMATLQGADGSMYFDPGCTMTPVGPAWPSPSGQAFFLQFEVSIPSFGAQFTVKSLMTAQDFPGTPDTIYEGVASVTGSLMGQQVQGTAWNEQKP